MKTGKSIEIPVGMLFRKFYCHRCGARLTRQAKKRIVTPYDPDWHEYNHVGSKRRLFTRAVEVTEYDFRCPGCGQITTYDDQLLNNYIQKKHDTLILSQALLRQELPWATEKLKKKSKVIGALWVAAFFVLAIVILLIKIG